MIKILFIPTYHQSLKTFLPIIKNLKNNYDIQCTMLIKNDFKQSEYLCKSEKIRYISINQLPNEIDIETNAIVENYQPITNLILKFKTILRSNYFIGPVYELVFQLKNQLIRQKNIYNDNLKLIIRESPSIIVVLNDQNELMMINIAKRLGIQTITLGWSVFASPRYFAKIKLSNNENIFKQWKLFILKLIIPDSIYKLHDRYILLLDPIVSIAYKINCIQYTLPGERGKLTNIVTATSLFQKQLILSYGVNSSKIILNGDNQSDQIFRIRNKRKQIRKKMINKLSLKTNDIVVLIAIPDTYNKQKSMFQTYRKSLVSILNTILSINEKIKIIAKVHPKDDLNDYLFINDISKNIILIKKYDMPNILTVISLFIVHISSSIIDAMVLGVPVITYNLASSELISHQLYSEEYQIEKSTIQVFDEEALASNAKDLLFKHEKRKRILEIQQKRINSFAIIDGKCVDRNMSTIINALKI